MTLSLREYKLRCYAFLALIELVSSNMAERRRRMRICQDDRQRLIHAFEEPDQDYLEIADTLGIKRPTARGIIRRYLQHNRVDERRRGGRNNVRVDDVMKNCLEEIVNENCLLTLRAINSELRRRLPEKPHVHDRTIATHLNGMLFTLKLSQRVSAERNRPDIIERRYQYAQWYLEEANLHHTIFIDECGFNIWTSRSHGRSRRGDRAYRQVCGQRGRNITICLAISAIYGVVHHTIRMGAMTGPLFNEFLVQTAEELNEEETHYLIFDGAPCHRGAENPTDDIVTRILPPYSPFLNPVEQAISCLKANIKADILRPLIQNQINDRQAARNARLPLGEYRKQILIDAAARNMPSITIPKCVAWSRLMQTYLPRCLAREHIQS